MLDGTFFAGSFSERWKRGGTKVVARYVDLVDPNDCPKGKQRDY